MKKIIIIFSIICISLGAMAQQTIRIGTMEFTLRIQGQDTTINVLDKPTQPNQVGETPSSPSFTFTKKTNFWSIGFIVPDGGSDFYSVRGGNSINLDFGNIRLNHHNRRFATGRTFQYSYYNYRFRVSDPVSLNEVLPREFVKEDIDKHVFRSHNFALSGFTRFYLFPQERRSINDGLYIDLGVQGDWAFSKYSKTKTNSDGNYKYRNRHLSDEAFNPFTASAIARIGWKGWGFSNSRAVFVRYRFTDAFAKALPMDLPPITVGIQFF